MREYNLIRKSFRRSLFYDNSETKNYDRALSEKKNYQILVYYRAAILAFLIVDGELSYFPWKYNLICNSEQKFHVEGKFKIVVKRALWQTCTEQIHSFITSRIF